MVKRKKKPSSRPNEDQPVPKAEKLSTKQYDKTMANFQVELVKLQKWIQVKGAQSGRHFRGA